MCCLMITTVWNVVMLRSNLIHHDGRWTRMISTTMIFSKCLFYCDTCTYGWICGTCISETVLMTMYDIPELHDYFSPLLSLGPSSDLNESMKCKLLLSPMCKNQDGYYNFSFICVHN